MRNWKITGFIVFGFLFFSIVCFLILGFNEESLLLMLRISAKVAIVIFLFAFLASTLVKIKSTNFTMWVLKNRRYIGVGFALVHIIHLSFVFLRHFIYEPTLLTTEPVARISGGIAYFFIFFMTLTSFDIFKNKINRKTWVLLHTVGGYFIWFIFFMTYFKRLSSGRIETEFYVFFVLLLTALVVKVTLKLRVKVKK